MKTVEQIRVDRLHWVMRFRQWKLADLAIALQRTSQQLSQVMNATPHSRTGKPRGIGNRLARDIETKLGLPVGLLDAPIEQSVTGFGYMAPGNATAEQVLRLDALTVPPPLIPWRDLKVTTLPEVFETALADDAMAPDLPRGRRVEFDRREEPQFGDKVLIRLPGGALHFRQYRQATRGEPWEACATNDAFQSFTPGRDGAAVLAVMTGYFVPRRTHV